MPEPLPLAELLETLKAKGLPIGVREHLAVGRLLSRWDDTDTGSLRVALGALLARNPDEVALVRTSFDTLYGASEPEEPKAQAEPEKAGRIPIPRRWIAAGVAALLAIAIVVTALLWPRPAKNSGHQQIPTGGQTVPKEAPPPPVIPDTYPRPAWGRSFAVAGGVAAVLFLWMYGTRLGREARRRARRRWSEEADALPGPHGYDLNLGDLAPPFSAAVLDDVATLLGRHAADPPRGGELDVNRTLERTIRAGLAPLPVFRSRASQHPLIVLEDVGAEMRPWRGTVRAFLKGLEARGVALDRWRFDGDAGRIFRSPEDPVLSLKQLFRLRPESPLLVISTGEGLLEGQGASPAAWIETLKGWRSRAWLQPVTDPGYWRPVLRTVPLQVWPMTPEGLLTTARQLAHGDLGRPVREAARAFSDRPVTALDIERLRWLISLAPRRDPDLAEQLRQRFCPHVPPSALLDALEMPAPAKPSRIGPTAAEVHTFLLEILDRSRPEPGTAAFEHWRLDRALQELRIPGHEPEATRELAALAEGPLAGEMETAMATAARAPAWRQVARTVRRRATRERGERPIRRWRWPDAVEICGAIACLAVVGAVLPRLSPLPRRNEPVKLEKVYSLTALQGGKLITPAVIREGPLDLVKNDTVVKTFATGINPAPVVQAEEGWYYLRQQRPYEEGVLKISNKVLVERPSVQAPSPPPAQPSTPPKNEPAPVQAFGTLEITDFPADVDPGILRIDGQRWSGKRRERVAAGIHQLRADRFSYRETIRILAGQTVTVRVKGKSTAELLAAIKDAMAAPSIGSVVLQNMESGKTALVISGSKIDPKAKVAVSGTGIEIQPYRYPSTGGSIVQEIVIEPTALPGPRDVTVTNPDGLFSTLHNAFSVPGGAKAKSSSQEAQQQRPPSMTRTVIVDQPLSWKCGDTSGTATYPLQRDEDYVSAKVELAEIVAPGSEYRLSQPVFDSAKRQVTSEVQLSQPSAPLLTCTARLHMTVTVRTAPKSQE